MPGLLHLPNEVLERIIILAIEPDPSLDLHESPFFPVATSLIRETILNIALVNRRLARVATPLRTRYWSDSSDEKVDGLSTHFRLAVSLLHKPELRLRLRRLEFHVSEISTEPGAAEFSGDVSQDDLERLMTMAENQVPAHSPDGKLREDWTRVIREAKIDAVPALALSMAPNVNSLAFDIPFFDPRSNSNFMLLRWLSMLIRDRTDADPPLKHLRHVYMRWWDTENSFHHKHVAPFYSLPNVKTLYAHRIGGLGRPSIPHTEDEMSVYGAPNAADNDDDDDDEDEAEEDAYDESSDDMSEEVALGHQVSKEVIRQRYYTEFTMSNIEELHFNEADLGTAALDTLISHCRRLKALKIVWCAVSDNSFETQNDLAWGYLLKLHAESLEVLQLDFSKSMHYWARRPYKGNTTDDIGRAIAHCRRLRKLRIELSYISVPDPTTGRFVWINIAFLPRTLEDLTVVDNMRRHNWSHHLETVEDYVQRGAARVLAECRPDGRLPKIRKLNLSEMLIDDPEVIATQELKTAAKQQGVELRLAAKARGFVPPLILGQGSLGRFGPGTVINE